jgi:hypothetical protein
VTGKVEHVSHWPCSSTDAKKLRSAVGKRAVIISLIYGIVEFSDILRSLNLRNKLQYWYLI